jgi:hypothetical protein
MFPRGGENMDVAEAGIWVILTLYGGAALAIFTAGLFGVMEGYYVFGAVLTVLGLALIIDAGRRVLGYRWYHIPNAAIAVILVLTWIFFGYDVYDRAHFQHFTPLPPIILRYGTQEGNFSLTAPRTCDAQFNGAPLIIFARRYRVALACEVVDPTMDPLDNPAMTMSRPFEIYGGPISISVVYSKPMMEYIAAHLSHGMTGLPKGHAANESYELLFQPVLLPLSGSCDGFSIRKMSDILRCGGKFLPGAKGLDGTASGPIT